MGSILKHGTTKLRSFLHDDPLTPSSSSTECYADAFTLTYKKHPELKRRSSTIFSYWKLSSLGAGLYCMARKGLSGPMSAICRVVVSATIMLLRRPCWPNRSLSSSTRLVTSCVAMLPAVCPSVVVLLVFNSCCSRSRNPCISRNAKPPLS